MNPVQPRGPAPGALVGIDETMIRSVVETFYARIRADDLLGPIFAQAISGERWPAHLDKMVTFWGSVLLMTGQYHGRPVPAHLPLPIGRAHFQHWLGLFVETARAVCPPSAADLFIDRAERIANSLLMACSAARVLPAGASPVIQPLASVGGGA